MSAPGDQPKALTHLQRGNHNVSGVLQPEIDTIQTQIAQLQAQIAAAQERVKALGEAESIAGDAIQSLQSALQKVSTLAPGVIATLRAAVMKLFAGDGNSPNSVPDELTVLGNISDYQDEEAQEEIESKKVKYRVIADGVMVMETTDYEEVATRHDVEKVWGMSLDQIERLSQCDLTLTRIMSLQP